MELFHIFLFFVAIYAAASAIEVLTAKLIEKIKKPQDKYNSLLLASTEDVS